MSVEFEFKFKNINSVNNKYPICRIEFNDADIFSGKVEQRIVLNADTQENNVLRIFFENKYWKKILDIQFRFEASSFECKAVFFFTWTLGIF